MKYRIVTINGRGLPHNVDADGYDTKAAASAMADSEHDGDYRIEAYSRTTGAARAFGGTNMEPEKLARFGLTPESNASEKMAKYAAALPSASDEDVQAFADDLEADAAKHAEPDGDEAQSLRAFAVRCRRMGAADVAPAVQMGEPPAVQMDVDPGNLAQNAAIHLKTGNVHDEGGRKKASALSADDDDAKQFAALARKVGAPEGATRSQVLAMAALAATPANLDAQIAAGVERALAAQRETAERERAAQEASDVVTFARTAGLSGDDLASVEHLAKTGAIALARKAVERAAGAPMHNAPAVTFGRMTRGGNPIGAPNTNGIVHKFSAPSSGIDRKVGSGRFAGRPVLLAGDTWADAAEELADSNDPVIMARIDKMIGAHKGKPTERSQRFLAAEKILRDERQDLAACYEQTA